MPEISRQVTLDAQKNGIAQLFLTKPLLFSELLLEGREKQYKEAGICNEELVFFDRGVPSIHAYMRYLQTDFPSIFIEKSKECCYTKVFQFLPWEEIYESDNERYENFEQSVIISKFLFESYTELNYNIINVPFGDVKDRCNFILNSL